MGKKYIIDESTLKSIASSVQSHTPTLAPVAFKDLANRIANFKLVSAMDAPTISVDSSTGLITASAGGKTTTHQLITKGATTFTPQKDASIEVANKGTFFTGVATVAPIPSEYIIPSGNLDISSNGSYDVSDKATVNVNVPTSEAMNIQVFRGTKDSTSASLVSVGLELTVKKTGVYTITWMGCRNTTSGTSSSQLYINGTAYGSANSTFVNSYLQSITLENVSLTEGQTIEVRARARSTSYRMTVGNLMIEQIA